MNEQQPVEVEQQPKHRNRKPRPVAITGDPEQLLSPIQVGTLLQRDAETIIRWFSDVEGVYDLGTAEQVGRHGKGREKPRRRKRLLLIPRWVVNRWLEERRVA